MKLEPHPLALIPPPLTKEQEQALEDSLLKNGQLEDIVTLDGMILNGNNRYRLLTKNGITPRTKEFVSTSGNTPEDYVVAMLQGRQLNIGQKACVGAMLYQKRKKANNNTPNKLYIGLSGKDLERAKHEERTYVKIAKEMGIGAVSTQKAIFLLNAGIKGKPYFDRVYSGEMKLESAYNTYRKENVSRFKYSPRDGTVWNASSLANLIKIPTCFESREVVDKFIVSMNKSGWILEVLFKDSKIFANWYGNGFPPTTSWKSEHSEFEFRRAVIVAANDKRDSILKTKTTNVVS